VFDPTPFVGSKPRAGKHSLYKEIRPRQAPSAHSWRLARLLETKLPSSNRPLLIDLVQTELHSLHGKAQHARRLQSPSQKQKNGAFTLTEMR